jgi:hypothetical protein
MLPNACPKPQRRVKVPKESKPRTKLKAKKRKPSEYARVYGSKARVEWVKTQPCMICGYRQDIDGHHIETEGTSRKGHYTKIVALCRLHHLQWHQLGRGSFNPGIDFAQHAANLEAKWQYHWLTTGKEVA